MKSSEPMKSSERREAAEAAAATWLARRERADWSDADQAAFDTWLAKRTDHRVAWLRLNAAWQETQRLKTLRTEVSTGTVPSIDQVRLPFFTADESAVRSASAVANENAAHRTQPRLRRLGVAAAAALLIGAGAVTWSVMPRNPAYQTAVGAIKSVPLTDGSRVTLNTDTRIKINLTPTERRINLVQGEAYFEVAKDAGRPFIVEAGDKRIVAVGTRFSVRRDAGEFRVFVTEGKVRVEQSLDAATAQPAVRLEAGSMAHAVADNVIVQSESIAEVEQHLAWRQGYLIFDKTLLADAVAEFNRYSERKIVIEDPAVAAIRIGGNFRATNVEAFLRLIQSNFPVVLSEESDRVVLTGEPPTTR